MQDRVLPDWWRAYERPWYTIAAASPSQVILTPPYLDVGSGNLAISGARTVNNTNADAGVVAVDIQLAVMSGFVDEINAGTAAYSFLIAPNADIVMHPNPSFLFNDGFQDIREVDGGRLAAMFDAIVNVGFYEGGGSIYVGSTLDTAGWYVITSIPTSYIMGAIYSSIGLTAAAVSIAVLIIIPVILMRINNMVCKPLRVIVD